MLNKLWILCCLFTTVNCMGTETDNPTAPEGIDFVRSDKAYLKSVDVPSADQASLQEGNLAFALDLYREIASGASADDNLFISPHSVSTLMAMTYAGARGNTQRQISAALHFNLAKEALHPAMNGLTQRLAAIGDAEESFVFEPLNSLWLQRDYQVQTGFLDILSQHYDTGVYQADFEREAAESRRSINQWISEATHGNIEELFPEGSIDALSRLALTNTVYLSGLWEYEFDEQVTKDGLFTLFSGEQVTVAMMNHEIWFPFAFHTDWRAVALPLKGTSVSLVCVLPNPGEFEQFEQSFDAARITEIVDLVSPETVKDSALISVTIPKFSFDSGNDLQQSLSSLGMKDAFDETAANFSGINDEALYISAALQKTHVAIDEKGIVAAAASGEVGMPAAISPSIKLNRPFLFFIWDNDTRTVLFVGRLVHPEGKISQPTKVEPPLSDPETICGILQKCCDKPGQCADHVLTEQQCIDSFAADDAAVVEQCADCYSIHNDLCGGIPCFCGETVCAAECPAHPF